MTGGELAGRVALIFGAGSGGAGLSNGEAAALAYAEAGAVVAAIDLNAAEAERVAAKIGEAGGTGLGIAADITSERDVAEAVAAVTERLGTPEILHNNVGAAHLGSVLDTDPKSWRAGIDLNLTGAYLTCRHALPHMLDAGRGAIVNVSSLASIRDTGYVYPVYNAAKAAVNQLTTSIALTYAQRGIRANAVLPGLIDTPMATQQITNKPQRVAARHATSPTGRMGSPRDVANAAVFLASDRAAYVNAVLLPVDGGLAAGASTGPMTAPDPHADINDDGRGHQVDAPTGSGDVIAGAPGLPTD